MTVMAKVERELNDHGIATKRIFYEPSGKGHITLEANEHGDVLFVML
jgi:hypothetical protein